MLKEQQELILSRFLELYDILIPKDDILRKIKELVDFSFVIEEIANNYNDALGRSAEDPGLSTLIYTTFIRPFLIDDTQ